MSERAIVDAALLIEDLVKRRAFITKACDGNASLLNRVESMLRSHETGGDFAMTSEFSVDGTRDNWATFDTKEIRDRECVEDQMDLGFLNPSNKPNAIGSLGHYEILQVLGQGGFGIVFKAFDEKLHRFVAIKVMNPEMAATSPPRKRFLREARSAAGVKHENIVGVYAVEEQPLPYLVMEYIDGFTLQQKLELKGPLEVPELLHLSKQMANGLAAAHDSGLIHRDIKPGNILIEKGADQKIKITDFGLARSVDDSSMTRTGVISGTPLYMAPEQAVGTALDHRSDLFSLGSVMYQMASGRPPFRAPTTIAVLRRVADDKQRPLQEIIPETPKWLVAIVDRLLEKKPDDRFQTAREVADLIGRYQSELQLNGKVTSFKEASKKNTPRLAQKSSENVANRQRKQIQFGTFATIVLLAVSCMLVVLTWMNFAPVKPSPSDVSVVEATKSTSELWTSLFDGNAVNHWAATGAFKVQDGLFVASGGGPNAISKDEYDDFELEAEWKIGPGANSGIYYREEATPTIGPGNEYQLLDDAAYSDKQPPNMQTGSLYGLVAPTRTTAKPVGEWNKTRILCQGTRVEHWLNDERVVEYDTSSPEWRTLFDSSSFSGKAKVATKSKGHILLQGHTGDVAFRSIRIREIPIPTNRDNSYVADQPTKLPVRVLSPIHGTTSLVPRPQVIDGLKSWGIVRSYPSGPFTGVGRMGDGNFVTTCVGSPCIFIHNADWAVQQLLLPKPVGDDGNSCGILASEIAPRSGRVAFVNSSFVLCVFDMASEQIVWQQQLKWQADAFKIAFCQNEKQLAFAGAGMLKIFSLEPSGPKISIDLTTAQGSSPRSLCWSPDDKELWMVGQDKTFYAFSAMDLKGIEGHALTSNKISAMALASDLAEVALVSLEGNVKIIRCADWSTTASLKLEKSAEVSECKWSPDKNRLAFLSGNRIEVWDRQTQKKLTDAEMNGTIVWRADSNQVTTLFNHQAASTLDIPTGKKLPVRYGPNTQKYFLGATSTDGTTCVGTVDGDVSLVRGSSRQQNRQFHFSEGAAISAISHQNTLAVIESGFPERASKVIRLDDGVALFTLPGSCVTWSPDDSRIATVRKPNLIAIYESKNGKELQRFEVEKGERIRTSWSPDGRYLAVRVAWEKAVVHLWDTNTEKLITHRDFPALASEVNNLWLAPAWRSNDSFLVPFADQVYELTTNPAAKPVSKIKAIYSVSIAHNVATDRSLVSQYNGISLHDGNGKEQHRFLTRSYGTLLWLSDNRRFVSECYHYYEFPTRGFDADKREQLGCCFPCLGRKGWLTIGPTGHYQGSEGIESEFRYVALHNDERMRTYTAAEFAKTFQWKNDLKQATFLDLVETKNN